MSSTRGTVISAGVHSMGAAPVSKQGIDEDTGTVDVYELCPNQGDSIMIVNCGSHFELRHHHWDQYPMVLTDQDIELMKQGLITWN